VDHYTNEFFIYVTDFSFVPLPAIVFYFFDNLIIMFFYVINLYIYMFYIFKLIQK